jgi:hypothetical protein
MAILKIPVTKAGNKTIAFDTDKLPEEVYHKVMEALVFEGLKVILNKGMSKITTARLEGEELEKARADAWKKAEENFANLMEGKVTKTRSPSATKVAGPIMTEARRLAKEVVRDAIKAKGMRVSHVEASEITKAANELIASDPSFIEQATANIEARTAKPVAIDITTLIHESPKLVAKAEKAKAERKATLSATQAGKAAKRKPAAHAGH